MYTVSCTHCLLLQTYEDPKTRLTELGRDSYNDRKTCLVYYYTQPDYGPAGQGTSKVGGVRSSSGAAGAMLQMVHTAHDKASCGVSERQCW